MRRGARNRRRKIKSATEGGRRIGQNRACYLDLFFCTVNDIFIFCHLECFYLCLKKDWIWIYYESVYTTYISIEIECTYHKLPKFLTKVSFLKLPNFKRNMVILVYAGVNNLEIKSIMSSNAFHKHCYRRSIPLHNSCC